MVPRLPDSQSGSMSIGGIVPVFDTLNSGIPRMPKSHGILVHTGGRVSLSFTELFPFCMCGMRRGNWGPERLFLSVCVARGCRAGKAARRAGSLLSDGFSVLFRERM